MPFRQISLDSHGLADRRTGEAAQGAVHVLLRQRVRFWERGRLARPCTRARRTRLGILQKLGRALTLTLSLGERESDLSRESRQNASCVVERPSAGAGETPALPDHATPL